jgi:Rieske Fe-S protein
MLSADMNSEFNRRDLFRGSLMLAGAPTLCCSTADVPPASISYQRDTVEIDLRAAADLARTGASARLVDDDHKLDLMVAHPEKNRFVVLDRPCSHGGGPVAYSHRRRTVQCTCWGHSEFSLEGKVLAGPAKRPLRVYKTTLRGSRLKILLEERPS